MSQSIETEQFLEKSAEHSERLAQRMDSIWKYSIIVGGVIYIGSLITGHNEIILPASIVAASANVVGDIVDTITTFRTAQVLKQLDSLGINHGYRETNTLLPDRPEEKDLLNGKHLLAASIAAVVSAICPPFGITVGLDHICAACHNEGLKMNLERQFLKGKPNFY